MTEQTQTWNGVEILTRFHGSPYHMWYACLDNYCEAADAGNPLHGIGQTEAEAIAQLRERLDDLNPLASWIGSDGKKYTTNDPEQVERMLGKAASIKWVVVPKQIRALDPSKWTQDEIDAALGIGGPTDFRAMDKETFCARFKAEMMRYALNTDESRKEMAEYAEQVGPIYWEDEDQREEGPEECAQAEITCQD